MPDRKEFIEKAKRADRKAARFGENICLEAFDPISLPHAYLSEDDFGKISKKDTDRMASAGVDFSNKTSSGVFYQKDTSVLHCKSNQEGIEIIPLRTAFEKHPWIFDYYWKLLPVDTDKYTASVELELHNGYVIRALPGSKTIYPVQACLYVDKDRFRQNIHNIVIVEEGAQLHMITGCATSCNVKQGIHVGATEYFIKKDATLSFTMIHNWAEAMMVRPRSAAKVAEGGLFINNFINMNPLKSLQMYPEVFLEGENAVARLYSMIVGSPGSDIDVGGRIYLKKSGCRGEMISRAISNGGKMTMRGHMIGEVQDIKAHLECHGLILNGGSIYAVPELEGQADGVEMSHEAAVGKIAQEEINYLMSRGLTEEEAVGAIIKGFLTLGIPDLPQSLQGEIDRAVEVSKALAM